MTNNLYSNVRRGTRSRGNAALWIGLAVCAAVIAAFVLSVSLAGRYQRTYWNYIGRLSDSTAYAYRNDCLQITANGQTKALDAQRAYDIYQLITNADKGRIQKELPSEEPFAVLHYGNDSTLTVWEIPASANSNKDHETDIFLQFRDEKGSYNYIAWNIWPQSLLRCLR